MARPLRLEFAGAIYHVTSRGDRREDIYLTDEDRQDWLDVLRQTCERFNWVVHAWCQMSNHYHLLVETVDGNLSRGMRQLNGQYTQRFNQRHQLVGHLFQGRYKAILVQRETYLLELVRYVVLNPLRARMVESLGDWPWSSFPQIMGQVPAPSWLDTDWTLSHFSRSRSRARAAYTEFVMAGRGLPSPLAQTRHQLILGEDAFIEKHRQLASSDTLREVSKAERRAIAPDLATFQTDYPIRDEAMARAYLSGAYTMTEIAEFFNVHYMTVSRAVRKFELAAGSLY